MWLKCELKSRLERGDGRRKKVCNMVLFECELIEYKGEGRKKKVCNLVLVQCELIEYRGEARRERTK